MNSKYIHIGHEEISEALDIFKKVFVHPDTKKLRTHLNLYIEENSIKNHIYGIIYYDIRELLSGSEIHCFKQEYRYEQFETIEVYESYMSDIKDFIIKAEKKDFVLPSKIHEMSNNNEKILNILKNKKAAHILNGIVSEDLENLIKNNFSNGDGANFYTVLEAELNLKSDKVNEALVLWLLGEREKC